MPRKPTQILLQTAMMRVDRTRSTIFFIDLRKCWKRFVNTDLRIKKNLIYYNVGISLPNYNTCIKFILKRVHRKTTCKDKNGREANAMLIFTLSIRYLKDHLLEVIRSLSDKTNVDDIDFVLTVPAIWSETTKLFMREAAIQVRQWLLHSI